MDNVTNDIEDQMPEHHVSFWKTRCHPGKGEDSKLALMTRLLLWQNRPDVELGGGKEQRQLSVVPELVHWNSYLLPHAVPSSHSPSTSAQMGKSAGRTFSKRGQERVRTQVGTSLSYETCDHSREAEVGAAWQSRLGQGWREPQPSRVVEVLPLPPQELRIRGSG